jgi:chromosome segregation ATPase
VKDITLEKLYNLVVDLSKTVEKLSTRVDKLHIIVGKLSDKVEKLSTRVDKLHITVGKLSDKMEKLSIRLDKLSARVGKHDNALDFLMKKVLEHDRRFDVIEERTALIPKLYDNVDKIIGEIKENRAERSFMNNRLSNHEKRIARLEKA